MKISKMLVLYRAAHGLDQRDLAKEIHIGPSTLSRMENGKNVQMISLVKLLGWLFE